MFDQHKNLAISSVVVAPITPTSGVTLKVTAGQGTRFPAPPFNVTICDATLLPSPDSAEVARCTAVVGDQLTLVRAQEGTTARIVLVGDLIAETITAQSLGDIESGQNFPLIQTPTVEATTSLLVGGDAQVNGNLTVNQILTTQDINAQQGSFSDINVDHLDADTLIATTSVTSPLGQFGSLGTTPLNPAQIVAPIPDAKLSVNVLTHPAGYPGGTVNFLRADGIFAAPPGGGGVAAHALTHEVGGSDQITGPMAFSTLLIGGTTSLTNGVLRMNTADGADTASLALAGGGNTGNARGGTVFVFGNENSSQPGTVLFQAGNPAGRIVFDTGGSPRGIIFPSGGFSWGNSTDPGATNLSVTGNVLVGGNVLFQNHAAPLGVFVNTVDGADSGILQLSGGGFPTANRGAYINLAGNEQASVPGQLALAAGLTGIINFVTGADVQRGVMHPSGGFSWGSATDPGAGNLSVTGSIWAGMVPEVGPGRSLGVASDIVFRGSTAAHLLRPTTADGADTSSVTLSGGGGASSATGGYVAAFGNEHAGTGKVQLVAGNVGTGTVEFYTGATTLRGTMAFSGGFTWGGTFDPGIGALHVGLGTDAIGQAFCTINPNANTVINMGRSIASAANQIIFNTPSGVAGFIQTTGTTTTYSTTSDQRLKIDRGRMTSEDALAQLVVHYFDWKADGRPGHGLFAQEAYPLVPHAVSVGSAAGQPWAIDYSQLVPDLIVALQQLQFRMTSLEQRTSDADHTP